MKFKYEIINGEAVITGVTDYSVANAEVPSEVDGYPVTSIGEDAFADCTSLKSVTIPDSVTSIGNYAFADCTSLKSVTIPDSVTSIGNSAFHNCTSLESVTIPDSVTSIGNCAFYNCISLESVTIPDTVTSIGNSAFYKCTSLESEKKAYKAFAIRNGKLFCRSYQFHEKEWADEVKNIELCKKGYHFCTNLFEIFNYYSGKIDEEIAIYECETGNKVITSDNSKCVTNKIKPVKRLARTEVIRALNRKGND